MVFAIVSNLDFYVPLIVGIIFTLVAVALMLFMLAMREMSERRQKDIELINHESEQLIFRAITNEPSPNQLSAHNFPAEKETLTQEGIIPPLDNEDKIEEIRLANEFAELNKCLAEDNNAQFLFLWNYFHETLRGNVKTTLNSFDNSSLITKKALDLLKSGSIKNKLLAIQTLGNLSSAKAWDDLAKIVDDPDPVISLHALHALFRIDTDKAIKNFLPLFATRKDWSPIPSAKILKEITADKVSIALTKLVEECFENKFSDSQMARVISYLSLSHPDDYKKLIERILNESNEQETIIACLRLVHSDDSLSRVRELFTDPRWQIRMQVVQTLSRLNHEEDISLLLQGLSDTEWWVRYRSAFSLASMSCLNRKQLEEYAHTLPDKFARDIMNHVLAEIDLKCLQKPSSLSLSN